ncbi:MAG: PDC sensor domain-containing protein [Nitrospirae bacterium]|nr:PDC sensor domain-containing protein [Nitrospirota bacterium]
MNRLESFHENRTDLQCFLGSILEGVLSCDTLKGGPEAIRGALKPLVDSFPFLDLCYVLDADGRQIGPNITGPRGNPALAREGDGEDRSRRPYYLQARNAPGSVMTPPYFSTATSSLCVTVATPVRDRDGLLRGVVVADIDFEQIVALLEDDSRRRAMEPFFKAIYASFSLGLLVVSLGLAIQAFHSLAQVFRHLTRIADTTPSFQATILLTLALAIFDLSKTIFEEEVLLRKDVKRHSATRRTLTRFIASILIAISIEALMLVFKFAIQDPSHLNEAGWLVFSVVGLLVGLGVYVYLGARAEMLLIAGKSREKRHLASEAGAQAMGMGARERLRP